MREILTQNNGIYYKERNKYMFEKWDTTSTASFKVLSNINKYSCEFVFEF